MAAATLTSKAQILEVNKVQLGKLSKAQIGAIDLAAYEKGYAAFLDELVSGSPAIGQPQSQQPANSNPDGIIRVKVGGEDLELFPFTQGRHYVGGLTMVAYGKKYGADMSQAMGEFLEKNWADLPASVRANNYIAVPKWLVGGRAVYLYDRAGKVYRRRDHLEDDYWYGNGLLARRPAKPPSA